MELKNHDDDFVDDDREWVTEMCPELVQTFPKNPELSQLLTFLNWNLRNKPQLYKGVVKARSKRRTSHSSKVKHNLCHRLIWSPLGVFVIYLFLFFFFLLMLQCRTFKNIPIIFIIFNQLTNRNVSLIYSVIIS